MTTKIKKNKLVIMIIAILAISGVAIWLSNNQMPSELEYRQQAERLAQQQDWAGLEIIATRWRKDYPKSSMSLVALGDSYRMRGNYSAAATEYAHSLEQESDNFQVWAYHGIMMLEISDFTQAAASCQSSVSINPQHANGWYCLALAQAELSQADLVSATLTTLTTLNPQLHATAKRVIHDHTCKKDGIKLNASLC